MDPRRYPGTVLLLVGLLLQLVAAQVPATDPAPPQLELLPQGADSDNVTSDRGSSDTSLTVRQNYVYYVEDLRVVKCHCGADEVLAPDGSCQYFKGGTSLDTEDGEVPTAWANTTIRKLQCPHQHSAFNFSRGDIHLRQRGDLVVQTGVMKGLRVAHYCLTHHLDNEGALTWTARTCIKPPTIPRCCPPGQIILEGGCVHAPSNAPKRWAPPLSAGPLEAPITWPVVKENLTHPVCTNDPLIELPLQVPNHMVALPKGVLLIWEGSQGQTVYTVRDYCIDGHLTAEGKTSYSAYLCYSDPLHVHEKVCKGKTCIRKCCPQGEAFHEYFFRCVPNDTPFLPIFAEEPEDYTLVTGGPLCSSLDSRVEIEDYLLSSSGHMDVLGVDLPPTDYCVDNYISGNGTITHKAHICLEPPSPGAWVVVQSQLLPVLLGISCMFLSLLVGCFVMIPELRAAEGSYQLSHVTSLLASFTAYFFLQIFSSLYYVHYMACMILALVVHFGFLAAFFWLSILCADLWRRVRHLKSFSLGAACTPFVYHLLGWGGPTAIIKMHNSTNLYKPVATTDNLSPAVSRSSGPSAKWQNLIFYFICLIEVFRFPCNSKCKLSFYHIMGHSNILRQTEYANDIGPQTYVYVEVRSAEEQYVAITMYMHMSRVFVLWCWLMQGLQLHIGPHEVPGTICNKISRIHQFVYYIMYFVIVTDQNLVL
ncbi:unnamed protein product, partial [Meganyctiphanes norvegica]